MIRRKDTLGFVDFMRGNYSIYNKEYILNMVRQMTNDEKIRLNSQPFSVLWEELWGTKLTAENSLKADIYKAEELSSKSKFESLKQGIYTKTDFYNLEELIDSTQPIWTEPEWGFPKGRRNYQERDYDCASREFCEETGFSVSKLVTVKNIQPFEEIFTGSNYKSYKHKYYLTYMNYEDTLHSGGGIQSCEISEMKWMTYEQCCLSIRSYNIEKMKVLTAVNNMLTRNCFSIS
jgi:ADP-ribose pyrophosphatase YjhB (NUDIX family)